MSKKRSMPVQMKKRNNLYVMNPELRTKVHKSKKDYDRNREKRVFRNKLKEYGY